MIDALQTDLFGRTFLARDLPPAPNDKKRKKTKAGGFAASPGGGPKGETCKSCTHYCRVAGGGKVFPKCGLLKGRWTHGPGTDIRAGSPACQLWKAKTP